jgi:hypothetical protein
MALIKCTKHGIPYNDDNPRGCPACATAKEGGGGVMQELARASQTTTKPPLDAEKVKAAPKQSKPAQRRETLDELFRGTAATISEEAAGVETLGSRFQGLIDKAGDKKVLKFGLPLLVALIAFSWFTNTADYVIQPSPAVVASPLPFPVEPGTPVEVLFAVLGVQAPQQHPTDRRLARFQYGSDLTVDALNGFVYSITFEVSNRVWQGISVGMSAESALGALALLGDPAETGDRNPPAPEQVGIYQVYNSLEERPFRQFQAAVRPPNGCLDVVVDVRYQAQGVLIDGDDRWIVVGLRAETPTWVATKLVVTDRSVTGTASLPSAC